MGKVYRTVDHNAFYCPLELKTEFESMGYRILGTEITPIASGSKFKVLSGPLCRLYHDKGKLTPHANETYWYKEGRKWREYPSTFLSYIVQYEDFPPREMTVRWETSFEPPVTYSPTNPSV